MNQSSVPPGLLALFRQVLHNCREQPRVSLVSWQNGHETRQLCNTCRNRAREEGSIVPLIVLFFLLAFLLVAGVTAASSAFLAQRDLQADCDGAAVAAASSFDTSISSEIDDTQVLPLAQERAQEKVEEYNEEIYPAEPNAHMIATVRADAVEIVCQRVVSVPFGAMFGLSDGLEREAISTARSSLH